MAVWTRRRCKTSTLPRSFVALPVVRWFAVCAAAEFNETEPFSQTTLTILADGNDTFDLNDTLPEFTTTTAALTAVPPIGTTTAAPTCAWANSALFDRETCAEASLRPDVCEAAIGATSTSCKSFCGRDLVSLYAGGSWSCTSARTAPEGTCEDEGSEALSCSEAADEPKVCRCTAERSETEVLVLAAQQSLLVDAVVELAGSDDMTDTATTLAVVPGATIAMKVLAQEGPAAREAAAAVDGLATVALRSPTATRPGAAVGLPRSVLQQLNGSVVVMVTEYASSSSVFVHRLGDMEVRAVMAVDLWTLPSVFDNQTEPQYVEQLEGLDEPVMLAMPVNETTDAYCVYWDEMQGWWSAAGVEATEWDYQSPHGVACNTTHLSLFASAVPHAFPPLVCTQAEPLLSLQGVRNIAVNIKTQYNGAAFVFLYVMFVLQWVLSLSGPFLDTRKSKRLDWNDSRFIVVCGGAMRRPWRCERWLDICLEAIHDIEMGFRYMYEIYNTRRGPLAIMLTWALSRISLRIVHLNNATRSGFHPGELFRLRMLGRTFVRFKRQYTRPLDGKHAASIESHMEFERNCKEFSQHLGKCLRQVADSAGEMADRLKERPSYIGQTAKVFVAVHPWSSMHHCSMFASATVQAMLLPAWITGSMAVCASYYAYYAERDAELFEREASLPRIFTGKDSREVLALAFDSDPLCPHNEVRVFKNFLIGALVALGCAIPRLLISRLRHRGVRFVNNEQGAARQLIRWRLVDTTLCVVGNFLTVLANFFIVSFLSNVSDETQKNWLRSSLFAVLCILILYPLGLSLLIVLPYMFLTMCGSVNKAIQDHVEDAIAYASVLSTKSSFREYHEEHQRQREQQAKEEQRSHHQGGHSTTFAEHVLIDSSHQFDLILSERTLSTRTDKGRSPTANRGSGIVEQRRTPTTSQVMTSV